MIQDSAPRYPRVDPATTSAIIDLGAFERNIARLRTHVGQLPIMVVVKADGYGHGAIGCVRAARAAGADWVGAATPAEALALRNAGDTGPLLCWLYGPDTELAPVVDAEIDITVHSPEQLSMISAVAATLGHTARIQLKIDTGLSRNGAMKAQWRELCLLAREASESGAIRISGIWSHLAAADEPGHPSIAAQQVAFDDALAVADEIDLGSPIRHLANSAAAITAPLTRYDLVRLGIACYGIEPAPGIADGIDLEPVMTVRSQLAAVKKISAGSGVSYGHSWVAETDTVIGLIPIGYADGIPWHAGNHAEVVVAGRKCPVRGRVCMDQFVVDLGPEATDVVGDEVIIFGSADDGVTVTDWAHACQTIGYEVVSRVGACLPRQLRHPDDDESR